MIEIFKWVKGNNNGNIDQVLAISSQDRTRGWVRGRITYSGQT